MHTFVESGDGYRIIKGSSNDFALFHERTSLSSSRWNLLKGYTQSPPAGAKGFGWPVSWMQLAINMVR